MGRPLKYEVNSRVHMGTRFDKEIITAFDVLCRDNHISRTQALERLVSHAIHTGTIPQFVKQVLSKPAAKPVLRGANVVEGRKLQQPVSDSTT